MVLSAGELLTALEVGIKPEDMILTSTSKTEDEVKLAVDKDVTVNIDSMNELKTVNEIAKKRGRKAKISIRVNPWVDPKTHPKIATALKESKFGLHMENNLAFNAYKMAGKMDNVKIEGIHML